MDRFKKNLEILSIMTFILGLNYIDIFWKKLFIIVLILKIFTFVMKSLRNKNPNNRFANYLEISCYGIFFGLAIQFVIIENGFERLITPFILFSPLILSSIVIFISLIKNGNFSKLLKNKNNSE